MLLLKYLFLIANTIWASEKLTVVEGEKVPIKIQGKVWIENGDIIKLRDSSVIGMKQGMSDLKVAGKEYAVQVITRNQNKTYLALVSAIKSTLHLSVSKSHGIIIVSGRLLRFEDWTKLAEACEFKECDYQMRATLSNEVKNKIQNEFKKKLQMLSLPQLKIEFTDKVQAHITPQFLQLDKLKTEFRKYGITLIRDITSIDLEPLVKVQITIAEVKKEEALKYGVQWPNTYTAQILPKAANASDPLMVSAQAYAKNGFGRILASPNILCRSGKEAKFEAGGEFPIKIITSRMQDVVWKKYGVILKVKPLADHSGRMRISLQTEISSIDPSKAIDGVPGMFTNRVESHFDLSEPQTIALSGLIKNESSQDSEGLPGINRIPILGALFSSKDFKESKSELVIFVRPEVVGREEIL